MAPQGADPGASSSWSIFGRSLRYCTQNFGPVLRLGWPLLVTLQMLEFFSDQYFDYVAELIQRRGVESTALLAGTAILEFLFGLVFSAAWFLAVVPLLTYLNRTDEGRDKPRFARSLRLHLNLLLIEQTRVFAAILGRLPFFILPAPIEYLRLSLVPYVVVLDPDYQRGDRDALETSRVLSRRRWLLLAGVFLFATVLPMALKEGIAGEGNVWLWEHPARVVMSGIAQFFANLAGSMVLFGVFEALAQVNKRGASRSIQ